MDNLRQYRVSTLYEDKLYLRFIFASTEEEARDIFSKRLNTDSTLRVEEVKED